MYVCVLVYMYICIYACVYKCTCIQICMYTITKQHFRSRLHVGKRKSRRRWNWQGRNGSIFWLTLGVLFFKQAEGIFSNQKYYALT